MNYALSMHDSALAHVARFAQNGRNLSRGSFFAGASHEDRSTGDLMVTQGCRQMPATLKPFRNGAPGEIRTPDRLVRSFTVLIFSKLFVIPLSYISFTQE
jgi:hypothetical protein